MSTVIQAIFEVQQGCQTFCTATTLTQTASQLSATAQTAVATAVATPSGTPGVAAAANVTRTIQIVAQAQFGCVAFCFGTIQTQAADQRVQVLQTALATGSDAALAQNIADGTQFILQVQEGCTVACDGATVSNSTAQSSALTQVADAERGRRERRCGPGLARRHDHGRGPDRLRHPGRVSSRGSPRSRQTWPRPSRQRRGAGGRVPRALHRRRASQAAARRGTWIQLAVAVAGPQVPAGAPACRPAGGRPAPVTAGPGATPAAARAPHVVARGRSHTRRTRHATVARHRPRARRMCLR